MEKNEPLNSSQLVTTEIPKAPRKIKGAFADLRLHELPDDVDFRLMIRVNGQGDLAQRLEQADCIHVCHIGGDIYTAQVNKAVMLALCELDFVRTIELPAPLQTAGDTQDSELPPGANVTC